MNKNIYKKQKKNEKIKRDRERAREKEKGEEKQKLRALTHLTWTEIKWVKYNDLCSALRFVVVVAFS